MNALKSLAPLALALSLLLGSALAPAHETPCPYCKLPVVQDTATRDNEVVLRTGNKRIEYRCVLCAFAVAKTKFKGDLTVLAPSTTKGKPVKVDRKAGEWSAPEGAVFVYQKGSHSACQSLYRAAASRAEAEAYIREEKLTEAKILSLKEMVELSK